MLETVSGTVAGLRRQVPAIKAACTLSEAYEGLPDRVTKHELLRRFKDAAGRLGANHGVVRLVETMVALTNPAHWRFPQRPICWASNDVLEAHLGCSRTTVQGYLRAAVRLGLMSPKDSHNGRRYPVYKQGTYELLDAFGYDLAPMAVRFDEFDEIAEEIQRELEDGRRLRKQITRTRRTIREVAAHALSRGYSAYDWQAALEGASGRTPRKATIAALQALADDDHDLLLAVNEAWDNAQKFEESEPRGSENGARYRPTTDPQAAKQPSRPAGDEVVEAAVTKPRAVVERRSGGGGEDLGEEIPITLVVGAVPELRRYLTDPDTADWDELAEVTRHLALLELGINVDALRKAVLTMGRKGTAAAVAMILARSEDGDIRKSAGGYLRALTDRAMTGDLNLAPSLYGLQDREKARRFRPAKRAQG